MHYLPCALSEEQQVTGDISIPSFLLLLSIKTNSTNSMFLFFFTKKFSFREKKALLNTTLSRFQQLPVCLRCQKRQLSTLPICWCGQDDISGLPDRKLWRKLSWAWLPRLCLHSDFEASVLNSAEVLQGQEVLRGVTVNVVPFFFCLSASPSSLSS